MSQPFLITALLGVVGCLAAAAPARAEAPRAVVELFTSQGCSSCPPADALLGSLAKDRDLVVLSLPVDYWDYLGWKDTLASPAFTARQKAYSQARGDGQIYTPQVVVDGLVHALGSDRAEIERAATAAHGGAGVLSVPVGVVETAGALSVTVGAASGAAKAGSLWLAPVVRTRSVAIGRGENTGRSVTYTNVVRGLVKLGDWTGAPLRLDVPASTARAGGADSFVVILQAAAGSRPGAILGVAKGPGL